MTGIANAFTDSTPMVVITGQVPRPMIGTMAFQEIDIAGITRPCTKYNYTVSDVSELAEIIHEAFYITRTGRPGPVLIDIPKDVTAQVGLFEYPSALHQSVLIKPDFKDTDSVSAALDKITQSKKPIFYVGGGLAGGVAAAIKSLKPEVKIWGVETKGAESMSKALEADCVVELPRITSIARTLGAPSVGHITFDLARRYLSGVTVVDDAEAVKELFFLLYNAKVLTEPAASCTLAAAAAERSCKNFTPSSHVVLILCGGNIGLNNLFELKLC